MAPCWVDGSAGLVLVFRAWSGADNDDVLFHSWRLFRCEKSFRDALSQNCPPEIQESDLPSTTASGSANARKCCAKNSGIDQESGDVHSGAGTMAIARTWLAGFKHVPAVSLFRIPFHVSNH